MVVKRQEFSILVRRLRARNLASPGEVPQAPRIAAKRATKFSTRAGAAHTASTKLCISRVVVGSFNVRIPVSMPDQLLRPEAYTLAITKARLNATTPTSRWFPVLTRHVGYLPGRVDGLGGPGSASSIPLHLVVRAPK